MKKVCFALLAVSLVINSYCEIGGVIEGSEISFYNGTIKVASWKLLPSGIFKYDGQLINGEINVISGEKDDIISTTYIIKNNIIQDNVYSWKYKTGEPAGEEPFNNGKLNGEFKWFYKNGQVSRTGGYENGRKNGDFKWYFDTGELAQEGKYKNGLKNGIFKIYYENGQTKEIITFISNKRNGLYQQFYDTGTIRVEGNFKNNLKDGKFVLYFESGEEAGVKIYKNGKLISEKESNEGDMDSFDLETTEIYTDL